MTTRQIGTVVFSDLASHTPRDRALKRLHDRSYLSRLTRPPAGGDGGGSGQHVYQLGRRGWQLLDYPGKFRPYSAASAHDLAVSQAFVDLHDLDSSDRTKLIRFDREQEAWRQFGTTWITPDAYIEVGSTAERLKRMYFLEVDRGTEKSLKIKDKGIRYRQAYMKSEEGAFPYVLFLAPDERRIKELQMMLASECRTIPRLFVFCLMSDLARFIASKDLC